MYVNTQLEDYESLSDNDIKSIHNIVSAVLRVNPYIRKYKKRCMVMIDIGFPKLLEWSKLIELYDHLIANGYEIISLSGKKGGIVLMIEKMT